MSFLTAEYFEKNNRRQFEERVVKHLLQRYGLKATWMQYLLQQFRRREQTTGLALWDFQELFPQFPIVLHPLVSSGIEQKNRTSAMLGSFGKCPVVREYRNARDMLAGDASPFGLVIKWPYLKVGGGAAVLHNLATDLTRPGQRFCFTEGTGENPLTLETLDGLLDAVDSQWPPNDAHSWIEVTAREWPNE